MILLLLIAITCSLGLYAAKKHQMEKDERGIVVATGVSLALIATILTIISAIISISFALYKIYDEYLWWVL